MPTLFSPAKVNLTLHILGTRPDGYHALDSVVVPLGFGDDVTLARGDAGRTTLEMVSGGAELGAIPADPERNLAVRAVRLLEREAGRPLPTAIRIVKRIPLGGGLGGGSSNAATVLRGAARLWDLSLSTERLCELGAELGSDVPLFVLDGTVRMRGRGERVERWPMAGAQPLWLVLANDGTHCPTPAVYGEFDRMAGAKNLTDGAKLCDTLRFSLLKGEPARVAEGLQNDLAPPCFGLFPSVARTAEALQAAGCAGVTLCGSGATVFGLAASREAGERALRHPALAGCWRACVQTLPDGVMAAHGPLTPIVMVRIHVGQPTAPGV